MQARQALHHLSYISCPDTFNFPKKGGEEKENQKGLCRWQWSLKDLRSSKRNGGSQPTMYRLSMETLKEDHKTGVGAVIWAEAKSRSCDGTGAMYFIGCGYNAFPVGSEYADFPHMDDKHKDREIRKFRYIIHAEQNALTFRCQDIKPEERSMLFVTKCPCDECVPLIKGAGIKQIYAGDVDVGKKKADISYMKFGELEGVRKFTWQLNPSEAYSLDPNEPERRENGVLKRRSAKDEQRSGKRPRLETRSAGRATLQ